MVVACLSLAHGLMIIKKLQYGAFKPCVFSIIGTYSKEERLHVEQIFKYESQLEPYQFTEIL